MAPFLVVLINVSGNSACALDIAVDGLVES